MARRSKAPAVQKTKKPRKAPPRPETLTVELDGITARVRRTVSGALADADRLRLESTAIGNVVGGLAGGAEPEEIRTVSAQLRSAAAGMLMGAARLHSAAERLETIAEIEELGMH